MGMTKYPFPVRVFPLLHPGRFTRWVPSYCQCGEKRISHMVNVGSRSERETRAPTTEVTVSTEGTGDYFTAFLKAFLGASYLQSHGV